MAQLTPTIHHDTLEYSENGQSRNIAVGSVEWYNWLETASTFSFADSFTARKEKINQPKGGDYWRAYREKGGKLYRAYLGKTQELSLERLRATAEELAENTTSQTISEQETLVATKLFVPDLPHALVARPRLTTLLNQAIIASRLILVSAPAGSGKTTSIVEWLQQVGPEITGKVAWVSLDEGDNEPVRFWGYVSRALEAGFENFQPASIEQYVTRLINVLTINNQSATLVLDDYHVINTPQIHQGVAFLIDRLPPRLRVIITSRVDPPLPLARLRLRRQLTELRSAELRFNQAETGAFLATVAGLALSPKNLTELENKTEGWAAALQLAALLMQSHPDVNRFIQNFSGSQRFMLDYLAEEVLQAQPEDVQNFLLQTAVLERMNAGLVEELTGCEDGQAMLQRLLQSNLFLIPLDEEHSWYRYHHLFRQYLLNRLEQTQPEHAPLLHGWAARWFKERGLLAEAIEHSLKAGAFLQAAELIGQSTQELYQRSELRTLWRWLEALPPSIIRQHPHSALDFAWVLILLNRYNEAPPYLEKLEEALALQPDLPDEFRRAMQGEAAAVQAFIARSQADFKRSIELSQFALEWIAPIQTFLRTAIVVNLAHCQAAIGNLPAAIQEYSRVENMGRAFDSSYFMLLGMIHQARLLARQGYLKQAMETCNRAIVAGETEELPVLGIGYTQQGSLWREWNELDKADASLNKAIKLLEPIGDFNVIEAYLEMARVQQTKGDFEAAHQYFEQAEEFIAGGGRLQSGRLRQVEQSRASFWLATGNLEAVKSWAARLDLASLREGESLLLARLDLAQQRPQAALDRLNTLVESVRQSKLIPLEVESLTLQALAFHQQSQPYQAEAKLAEALQLAEPEGFIRTFLDEGQSLRPLLESLRKAADSQTVSYLDRLLAGNQMVASLSVAPAAAPPPVLPPKAVSNLPEALTERELAVLQMLATTTLDSTGIAEELSIAVSTLRTHIKNIYGKLEVQSRLQAITRARQLGLISE